jgi:hypothetical protein
MAVGPRRDAASGRQPALAVMSPESLWQLVPLSDPEIAIGPAGVLPGPVLPPLWWGICRAGLEQGAALYPPRSSGACRRSTRTARDTFDFTTRRELGAAATAQLSFEWPRCR